MYNNLYHNDKFVFNMTTSGVDVYDHDLVYAGCVALTDLTSIYSDNSNLYMATDGYGVLFSPVSSIASGVFNDVSVFKQQPDITSNNTKYIHGAGEYLLVTTESGVDQYNTTTSARIYNNTGKSVTKCFQTSSGRFYYVSNEILESFYDQGVYKTTLLLNPQTPTPDYQVKITITNESFDYGKCRSDGSDILFFGQNQDSLSFYLEEWNYYGESTFWVKVHDIATTQIYMVYGGDLSVSQSDPVGVFDLYDNFDYPVAEVSTNYFLPAYGDITCCASGVEYYGNFFDGNTVTSGSLEPYAYVQIEFFEYRKINILKLWLPTYDDVTSVNGFYLEASDAGLFDGEETIIYEYDDEVLPGNRTYTFLIQDYYLYYRLRPRNAIRKWSITEIQMFTIYGADFTTTSGCPWVYASDPFKFSIPSAGILTCAGGNNDYIRTEYNQPMPIIIEQRVRRVGGASGKIAYTNILEPNRTGIKWYPTGTPTFVPVFAGSDGAYTYNLSQAMPTSWGVLRTYIIYGNVRIEYEGSTTFSNAWAGATSNATNRSLIIFGGDPQSEVQIDWIRTRKYSLYAPEVVGMSTAIKMEKKYNLNVMYDNVTDWTDGTVDYFYEPDDNVLINDIFITEGTSAYSPHDNVIFVATSDGLIVLEERRGDEKNSRIKYFKARVDLT